MSDGINEMFSLGNRNMSHADMTGFASCLPYLAHDEIIRFAELYIYFKKISLIFGICILFSNLFN